MIIAKQTFNNCFVLIKLNLVYGVELITCFGIKIYHYFMIFKLRFAVRENKNLLFFVVQYKFLILVII